MIIRCTFIVFMVYAHVCERYYGAHCVTCVYGVPLYTIYQFLCFVHVTRCDGNNNVYYDSCGGIPIYTSILAHVIRLVPRNGTCTMVHIQLFSQCNNCVNLLKF